MNAKGAEPATLAHLGIHEFVGRIVDQGKTLLLSADRYPIQNFDSRGADQHSGAKFNVDTYAVFF